MSKTALKKKQVKVLYQARSSTLSDKEAQKIGEILEKIEKEKGGVQPSDIVEEARTNDFLNNFFEWDNRRAGEMYRLEQARNLVRQIVIRVEEIEDKPPIRAYVSVNNSVTRNKEYVHIYSAMSRSDYKTQIISKALNELNGWTLRYEQYKELGEIVGTVDEVVKKFKIK